MFKKWFGIHEGKATDIERIRENWNVTEMTFMLGESTFHVPGQVNARTFIKENDNVTVCSRPSIFNVNKNICLAYKINGNEKIHTVNEYWNISRALICYILLIGCALIMPFDWRFIVVAAMAIYYSITSFESFNARWFLAKNKLS